MPTHIPIYRDELFARLDKDKAEIKKEMGDLALLILAKLDEIELKISLLFTTPEKKATIEVKQPGIQIQPIKNIIPTPQWRKKK